MFCTGQQCSWVPDNQQEAQLIGKQYMITSSWNRENEHVSCSGPFNEGYFQSALFADSLA